MRFLLISTHIDQTTGYSKVAHAMLKQLATLAPKVKTFHFGFQRHPSRPSSRKVPPGIVVYDAAANEEPKEEGFGFNCVADYIDTVGPDVVMIYNDPLIIHQFLTAMKYEKGKTPYKVWCYVDQVYHGIAPPLMESITKNSDRIFCFTEEWKKAFVEQYAGAYPPDRLSILEHAVDPTVFTHMNAETKANLRGRHGIPENAVVLLNANRNTQRKRLDLTIQAFVNVLQRKPSVPVYLMIVTSLNPQAGAYYDCMRIFNEECRLRGVEDVRERLLLVDTAPPNALTDSDINNIYNMTDIGVNTSDGEGFGLCQLEHMYTGAPQVVTDVGSYRTFLNEKCAVFVRPTGDRVYMAGGMPLGLYTPTFRVQDVGDAMYEAVENLIKYQIGLKEVSFKSWAKVCDDWLELVLSETKQS